MNDTIDEILHRIGTDIDKVYTSDPLNGWCMHHYFKLIDGRCVGCEAKQAIQSKLQEEYKRGYIDGGIAQLRSTQ